MNLKAGLYSYLMSKTLVTDVIGADLFPEAAPQGTELPFVTYEFPDDRPTECLTGASALTNVAVIFTIHAETPDSRDAVKEAFRNVLHARRNTTLDGPIDMRSAFLTSIRDLYDSPPDGSETGGAFKAEMDFTIIFFETVPTLP